MAPTNYVGLACTFHDPALAVVNAHGELVFAEGMERPYQTKRAFNCPADSLSYVTPILREYCDAGAELVVARSWSGLHRPVVRCFEAIRRAISLVVGQSTPLGSGLNFLRFLYRSQLHSVTFASENLRFATTLLHAVREAEASAGKQSVSPPHVTGFNHHLTHAAAGCYTSPFREAVCAVIDGFGELTSTAYYHYSDGKIEPLRLRQRSSNSLGIFYAMLCEACGFESLKGEEWKVMGLAPYGQYNGDVYKQLRAMLPIDGLRIRGGLKHLTDRPAWGALSRVDPADLAYTGQKVFEECMTELLRNLYALNLSQNLVLGGGCALNSSYNGQLLERTGFKNLHVFAAPADDGNAAGAALLAYYREHPDASPPAEVHTPYLGSRLSPESLQNLVRFDRSGNVTHRPGEICELAADALAAGKIIGWVQGRAEFGPRALGNRSILADARRPDVKDEINSRVKFREEFRPFAPAILHEHGPAYFEHYQESPYMERTLRFKDEVAGRVPGVVHVNGTGRLQTVRCEHNEKFHALLTAYYARTGVPLVLNTSFNIMGKPIIHSVEDALALFYTTDLDALAIEDYWIEK